jgi:CRP-like cAMP-binding protein
MKRRSLRPKNGLWFHGGNSRKETAMSLYEIINDMNMFENFSEKEKKAFAKMDHVLYEFKKDDVIIKEGDSFTSIYLILKGTVLITKNQYGRQIRLSKLEPGEIFGEMSYFSKKPRQSTIIAHDDDVMVLKMDEDFFQKAKSAISDKVKDYFIKVLCDRLDIMNESIMNISKLMRS